MTVPRLNRKLVLEYAVRSQDGAGGYVETWEELGVLWGQITPRKGRLTTGLGGAVSVGGFKIIVRGAPEGQSNRPDPGQRMRMGTRIFRIDAVTESEPDGMYLICETEEELAA